MTLASLSSNKATSAARAALLLLCVGVTLGATAPHLSVLFAVLALLGALALVASTAGLSRLGTRLTLLVEAAGWSAGVLTTGAEASPLLPYLLAPAFAGGLGLGLEGVLLPIGAAGIALLAFIPALGAQQLSDVVTVTGEWITLGLVVGLLGSWVRALQRREMGPESYLVAYDLLDQLRAIARRLPAGLDRSALADALLRDARAAVETSTAGAVFVKEHGGQPSQIASSGAPLELVTADLTRGTLLGRAWSESGLGIDGSLVSLPLLAGTRTVGLLVLALEPAGLPGSVSLAAVQRLTHAVGLPLETALLFDELREIATNEERQRLAREIHDGVAQDLAAFGYELDALAHEALGPLTGEQLSGRITELRTSVATIVTELRHSIFELRTSMQDHTSLGAALAQYAEVVGRGSGLTVHLTLSEGVTRLAADTEAELLRIAQEAITNSRRHADARNLWISCRIDPPAAELVIEDDGSGLRDVEASGFGLEIMRERAARLHAQLDIAPRQPAGTVVTCTVGPR